MYTRINEYLCIIILIVIILITIFLGLCLALRSFNNIPKEQHVVSILRHLIDNYYVDGSLQAAAKQHENQDISLITSDEVQFSVMVSLGYLTTLVLMDEKLTQEIINLLISKLIDDDKRCVFLFFFTCISFFEGGLKLYNN